MKKISEFSIKLTEKSKEQSILNKNNESIFTGFTKIDNFTNGFERGELILIGSRPTVGKSTLGLQIALNISKNTKNSILIYSLELYAKEASGRLLSYLTSTTPYSKRKPFNKQNLEKMQEGISELTSRQIFIDDSPSCTIKDIISKSQELKRSSKIDLILIDYLQLINLGGNKDFKEHTRNIFKSLKELAEELDCPIIILSQLNNGIEFRGDYRPLIKDIRHCEDIIESIDHVILISKKKATHDKKKKRYFCDITIYNGNEIDQNSKSIKLAWNNEICAFENQNQVDSNLYTNCYNPSLYSFENFISSCDSYGRAKGLCLKFATSSHSIENITALFINGDFGLGKSHLLQAMFKQISQSDSSKKVSLLNSREFTDELVQFITFNKYNELILKYTEDLDILFIDDIHYFKNKTASQETLSIIIDYFLTTGKQIAITSAFNINSPAELNSRLANQLAQFVSVKLCNPGLKTCSEIISQLCEKNNFNLSNETICLIAETTERNPRALKGKFMQIKSYCDMLNVNPTLEIVSMLSQENYDS